jgi:DNA repair exonuclease SbcCD ATPase subunit
MRLISLAVSGFRGFAAEQTFDLDADAIIVIGTNGNGKTSLFDAILWALCGKVPRLGSSDTHLLNQFSETGLARVALHLRNDEQRYTITRTFDGEESRISLDSDGHVTQGPQAEAAIIQILWSRAAASANPSAALASVVARSVYLQQDLVRQFIDSATDKERFAAVSELVGAGRVSELQAELEKAKIAWTKATHVREAELEAPRARLAGMEVRLASIEGRQRVADQPNAVAWSTWWETAKQFGVKVPEGGLGPNESSLAIDLAIKRLEQVRQAAERRNGTIRNLAADVAELSSLPATDKIQIQEEIAIVRTNIAIEMQELAKEQSRLANDREAVALSQTRREQLQTLARLALDNLGDECPVCGQDHDVARTRARLSEMVHATRDEPNVTNEVTSVQAILARVAVEETQLAQLETQLRIADAYVQRKIDVESRIRQRLSELAIQTEATADLRTIIEEETAKISDALSKLSELQKQGEELALSISVSDDEASVSELRTEIQALRERLHQDELHISSRNAAGEEGKRLIDGLRHATSAVVQRRIEEIEPILREMYERIDVHPAFRIVQFLASIVRGQGHLSTIVKDPLRNIECRFPSAVLSSSQLNALAVCTFLSLNLGMSEPPLQSALLDDPLQSLDDINLLGLIDLLRRVKDTRQLCVSTHDKRFGQLLARKLRPGSPTQRTIVIELEAWDRDGPLVRTSASVADPTPLRLLA